jgi:hypothetical protein
MSEFLERPTHCMVMQVRWMIASASGTDPARARAPDARGMRPWQDQVATESTAPAVPRVWRLACLTTIDHPTV